MGLKKSAGYWEAKRGRTTADRQQDVWGLWALEEHEKSGRDGAQGEGRAGGIARREAGPGQTRSWAFS